MMPRAGDVVQVGRAASVQFTAPILFRIIRVHDWETYVGWVWLDGYELNQTGDAVERRSIFVQISGLRAVGKAPDPRTRTGRVPQMNALARNGRQPGGQPAIRPGNTSQRLSPQRIRNAAR